MVMEVVRKYEPDMIWFDFELKKVITPEYEQRMFADYYNWAAAHGKESAVAHKFRDIHEHTGILKVVNPSYSHSFGATVPELLTIGTEERA